MSGFQNVIIIQTNKEIEEAAQHLSSLEWIGLDCETTDLNPLNGKLRLLQLCGGDTTYVIDLFDGLDLDPLRPLLEANTPRKVIHNAKFDAKWIKHHMGIELGGIFCTMLADQLLSAGDGDWRHSLAAVSERYLGIVLDKTEQLSDWGQQELDQAQIEYAAKDAAILCPLKDVLVEELEEAGLTRVHEIENECVIPVACMELNGFKMDKQEWSYQLDTIKIKRFQWGVLLQQELGVTYPYRSINNVYNINLGSPVQVTDALKWAGVPIKDSTEEWVLQPLAAAYPIIDTLLEYRGLAKAEDSYGESWFDYIHPNTGRIHAEFNQMRAKTGRFSSSSPNLQQIPRESAYRSCFIPEPGNKFIVADYSQIELRILADRSGDEKFIEAFNSGVDLHTATASAVFDVPIDEVDEDLRYLAKRLNFGLAYGITARKFSALTDRSVDEAEEIMQKYFKTYWQLDMYLREEGRQSIVDRECRTESGRLLRLRFDEKSGGSVSAAVRNGVNAPIQGTSADILKRSLRLLHDRLKRTTGRIVNIVHDEIVVECAADDALILSRVLEDAMIDAGKEFVTRVPIEVDATIADMWKKE